MCAEELTNQVLYMRNIPAGDKDIWMTFEAIEDGQLGEFYLSDPRTCSLFTPVLPAAPTCLMSSPQSDLCTPKRKFWSRRCSGARWPTQAPPTWW